MASQPPPSPPPSKPGSRVYGERRNFNAESIRTPHKFPIGTRVYMFSDFVSALIGPLYVVEYCEQLCPQGPPQYILQPTIGPTQDTSKFVLCEENMLIECREDDPPVDIEITEAVLLWHWLSETELTN